MLFGSSQKLLKFFDAFLILFGVKPISLLLLDDKAFCPRQIFFKMVDFD
jgi:hypothetical protein